MRALALATLAAALVPGLACGMPASSITGNVALTSDYLFRGLTQSWSRPAIQGGADYADPNGFAAGFWASSVSERSYPGGTLELDFYASYGLAINNDWSWRAGIYGYAYPGANLDQAGLASRSLNTIEANVAVGWKQFTLKYNRALTDYFGVGTEQGYRGDSRGTGYLQLDATFPLGDAIRETGLNLASREPEIILSDHVVAGLHGRPEIHALIHDKQISEFVHRGDHQPRND